MFGDLIKISIFVGTREKGFFDILVKCLDGGTGRHAALKMLFPNGSAGSIPAPSTKKIKKRLGRSIKITYLCKTNNKGIVESKKRETRKVYQPVNTR